MLSKTCPTPTLLVLNSCKLEVSGEQLLLCMLLFMLAITCYECLYSKSFRQQEGRAWQWPMGLSSFSSLLFSRAYLPHDASNTFDLSHRRVGILLRY